MKDRDERNVPRENDPQLDVPSEANTGKHINFLDIEDDDQNTNANRKDEKTEERQKQWKQGLEEGKRARDQE